MPRAYMDALFHPSKKMSVDGTLDISDGQPSKTASY